MNLEITPENPSRSFPEIQSPEFPLSREPKSKIDRKLNEAFAKNNRLPDFSEDAGFHRGPRRRFRGRKTLIWSFTAAVIDTLLFVAFVMALSWVGLKITQVSFATAGSSLTNGEWIFLSLIFFVSFSFCYLCLTRLFLRATVGEWACGLEVESQYLTKNNYVTQILARSFLVCASGFLVFPLLSLLLGKDLAGHISGTQVREG